jgi:hypothetical protein
MSRASASLRTGGSGNDRAQGGRLCDRNEEADACGSNHHQRRREQGTAGAERGVAGKSTDLGKNLHGRPPYIVPNNISSGS